MPIEKWSETILVVHMGDDPQLSEDMELLEMEPAKGFHVVLDFAGVRAINSSNIAALLRLRRKLITNDTKLVLCNVDNQVWGTLLVTGLDKVFEVSDSVSTALATVQLAEPKKTTRK
jgi:anti-anti-sigma factor